MTGGSRHHNNFGLKYALTMRDVLGWDDGQPAATEAGHKSGLHRLDQVTAKGPHRPKADDVASGFGVKDATTFS